MSDSGVYKITHIASGKCYIGSSVGIKGRWNEHKRDLNHKQHHSQRLQNAWSKYSADEFMFSILEYCEKDKLVLLEREQYYIDTLLPYYNICPIAGSRLGSKSTDDTKLKLRGMTNAYNSTGKIIKVSIKDYKENNMTCPNTGKSPVIDNYGNRFLADKDHPNIKNGTWVHVSKNLVSAFDTETNSTISVTREEFNNNTNLVGVNKNKVSGADNPNAKQIAIYNAEGQLIHTCIGNFKQYCIDNNLPFSNLRDTMYNDKPLSYDTKRARSYATRRNILIYAGWYAKLI